MGYLEALEKVSRDFDAKVQQLYTERNNCAIAAAKFAVMAGLKAGRGLDNNPAVGDEWRHIVYIDLPNGMQVSYHIAPANVPLLDGLPPYYGKWDGSFNGRREDWAGFSPNLVGRPV